MFFSKIRVAPTRVLLLPSKALVALLRSGKGLTLLLPQFTLELKLYSLKRVYPFSKSSKSLVASFAWGSVSTACCYAALQAEWLSKGFRAPRSLDSLSLPQRLLLSV